MTITEIQNNAKTKMEKTKDVLRSDLMAIRAGRANPQLLDRITVDYYGTPTPLKNVANISAPEPRILQINPWDAKMVKDISRAIQASDLGLTPSNDGKVIRLMLPELTEERRKELTKLVRKTAEESKVAIRSIRRDAVDQVKKLKKNNEITEDDQKKAEEDIQKLTDAAIKDIDKIDAEKEKEIMEVEMRTLLLGLPLKQAEAILGEAGISPQVRVTDAPRREKKDGGTLRVVFASDDGKQLVAARFFDPISDPQP